MKRRIAFLCTLSVCAGSASAQFIDFEGAPGAGNPTYVNTPLVLGDFQFNGEHFHTIDAFNIGNNGAAQNGSLVYLSSEGGSLGRAITMSRTDGGAFDIFGLDAAELWIGDLAGFPNASQVRVTGNFQGGGSITAFLPLDGMLDGAGGIDDFETFALAGFTNLASFEFNGVNANGTEDFAFGVDNIQLVPTPISAALLGFGGLVATRRRR